jgi:hypothetical protein
MQKTRIILLLIVVCGLLARVAPAAVAAAAPDPSEDTIGRTPARLSFVEGQVSFWRPGAEEWSQAQINIALAPGDQLFAGPQSRMELQIAAQAFVRGGADTQIGLESQEPDFIQLKVTEGRASIDVRSITPGRMVEVGTPHAAFLIRTEGYYRLNVGDERTEFITRRGGRATAISAGGDKVIIGPNEQITAEGNPANPIFASQTAPALDSLDQWNYARTEAALKYQESARHVSPEIYGISELDRHGTWRVVPTYGTVWVPRAVAVDWVPYSTGSWMHDPYYGWTWVDTMPWGWAPFHYGRWVRYSGYWAWAPGPRVVRPVYAPALVAFYGQPGFQVSVGFSGPVVGWVSLSWGEPLIPWWGRPGFVHRPWWGGWAGPRIVNNRVVHHTTVINVTEINVYRNMRERNAVVVVDRERFGRGPTGHARIRHTETHQLRPSHAAPGRTSHAGLLPSQNRGIRPPEAQLRRDVVSAGGPSGRTAHIAAPADRGSNRSYRSVTQQPRTATPQRPSVGRDANQRNRHGTLRESDAQRETGTQRQTRVDDTGSSGPPRAERPSTVTRSATPNRPEQQSPQRPAVREREQDRQPANRVRNHEGSPALSEPRSPERSGAAARPATPNRPQRQAPPPPSTVGEGGTRNAGGQNSVSNVRPERPNVRMPAATAEPRRSQAPERGPASNARVTPAPAQGAGEPSPAAPADRRIVQERPSAPSGQRNESNRSWEGVGRSEGRQHPQMQNNRQGRELR